jgi:UDP-N-acetylmuramate dehydrogenase
MHGGNHFFGDFVHSAYLYDGQDVKKVQNDYFQFGYDWSILHSTAEIVLEANLILHYGDTEKAKALSVDWARRKSLQPQKSAGCIFQNLTKEQQQQLDLPTSSIGYLIDKVLGLKGLQKGDAIISPEHAAFIVNRGKARAADVYYLYKTILQKANEQLGIKLKPEVEFIGLF